MKLILARYYSVFYWWRVHPIGSRQPLLTFARFIAWQIASSIFKRDLILDWFDDAKFLVRKSETSLTGNVYAYLNETNEMAFVLHYLRKDDLFVDIGANSGIYTILASKVIGARSFSIEPNTLSIERIRSNVNLNQIESRVTILPFAVGSFQCLTRMTANLDSMNHIISNEETLISENTQFIVEQKTLDDLIGNEQPNVMKLDVEGYEYQVLLGSKTLLSKTSLKVIICEITELSKRFSNTQEDIFSYLYNYGFEPHLYDPFERKAIPLSDNSRGNNVIFIRKNTQISTRIKQAKYRKFGFVKI